jgi:GPH family glycoside/pentoside/hexuronide:cation symporter
MSTTEVPPLPRATVWVHGSMGLPLAVVGYPIAIWVIPHYSGALGISLAAVGTMLMLARISDVVTDPLIGFASDRLRTRFGRRKPWIFVGMPLMMIGIWMLFVPAPGAGVLYLLWWLFVMMLGATMISLPYGAWGAELSMDYHQRSRVTAAREIFVLAGLLLAAFVPFMVELFGDRATGPVLEALAWTILVVLPICGFLILRFIREPEVRGRENIPFSEGLSHMRANGPLKRILVIILFVIFGEAFRNALSLFFMRDVVGIEAIGTAYLVYFATGLAAIPLWLALGRRIGKHRAFAVSMLSVSLISVTMYFLERGDYWPFMILFLAKGFCFGGLQFLPLAMLADVVDVDSLSSGGRRAGVFFAIAGMTSKGATAFGSGFSVNFLAFTGFDPSGQIGANGVSQLTSLAVLYAIVPAIFFCSALYVAWYYPLTSERHAELRAELAAREEEDE